MKYCPQCQTTYTDDLLKYCLKDGAPLGEVFDSSANTNFADERTVVTNDERTVVTSSDDTPPPPIRRVEPIRIPVEQKTPVESQPVQSPPIQYQPVQRPPAPQNYQPTESPVVAVQPVAPRRKTGSVVALTILGTLLLLGIAGLGAMLYLRNQNSEVAVANANGAPANRPVNANSANIRAANQNINQNTNADSIVASPTPTATPAEMPKPTVEPQRADEVAAEVENVVGEWTDATENRDIGGQLSQYAETVNYYTTGRVSRARVRADKDRAFGVYDKVNIDISNLKVSPDDSGENATALFDKEWNFEGDGGNSSGKVQQQLTFSKIGGKWLITGERDLKVYYVNK